MLKVHTNRFSHIQRLKTRRSSIRYSPRPLLLDVMEERDDIPQTAIVSPQSVLKPLMWLATL